MQLTESGTMDAIQFILRDHREIERLFKQLERAERSDATDRASTEILNLTRELSTHAVVEEQYVYPALRDAGADTRVLDALEDHHAAKLLLSEIDSVPTTHPRFGSKLRVLAENVRRHLAEEERELLPLLERTLDDDRRRELGDLLERAKRAAPTRPHPAAPDTPPGVFVVGAVAALYDRSRDALRGGTEVIRTLAAQGASRTLDGAKKLAARARERSRGAVQSAAEQGRAAMSRVTQKSRAASEEARDATARVELRGAEAASSVARRMREAATTTRSGAPAARRRSASSRRRGRKHT
jgi:hemerythrin-like domain-containing protein